MEAAAEPGLPAPVVDNNNNDDDDDPAEELEEEVEDQGIDAIVRLLWEGRRRNLRHLDIQKAAEGAAYTAAGGALDDDGNIPEGDANRIESVWRVHMPRRLLALSHLGVFKFHLLATQSAHDVAFYDEHHPMVTTGHMPLADGEPFVARLRQLHPGLRLIAEGVRLPPAQELGHAICAFAAAAVDAPFYYYAVAAGLWMVVDRQLTAAEIAAGEPLPDDLAAVAPPMVPYANRVISNDAEHSLSSFGGLMRLARIIGNSLGGHLGPQFPFFSGPDCSHVDGLRGFLAAHVGELDCDERALSVEDVRQGLAEEDADNGVQEAEPLPDAELEGWTRVTVFGTGDDNNNGGGGGDVGGDEAVQLPAGEAGNLDGINNDNNNNDNNAGGGVAGRPALVLTLDAMGRIRQMSIGNGGGGDDEGQAGGDGEQL